MPDERSVSDLQALLRTRDSENRALTEHVAELEVRIRELEAELGALKGKDHDPVIIEIDSDSETEDLQSSSLKHEAKDGSIPRTGIIKKRSASPAVAPTDNVDNKPLKMEDVMPPPAKRPRTKMEVLIDNPRSGPGKSRGSRRVSSASASIPLRDDGDSERRTVTVKSEDPANADDHINVDTKPDMNEPETENDAMKQEPEPITMADAEPGLLVKDEDEEKAILASAAATLSMLPKPELKKGLDFDAATIQSRIDAIGREPYPITLDPTLRATCVSRAFMSKVYGGNEQRARPRISKKFVDKHGLDDFFYLSLLFHPYGPREPGQPGLWFHSERTIGIAIKEERTFVRLRSAEWLYVGQYRMDAAEPLTQTEWMMQSDKVRKKWAQEILSEGYGRSVRFRVIFRRELGRDPTEEEEQDGLMVNDPFINLTWEEIRSAYDSGKERMGIDTMKCVGYDEEFQRDIATQFPTWVPPPSKKALKAKESKDQAQKAKGSKAKKAKTRKEEIEDESEAEDYSNHWSEGEDDRLDDRAAEASTSHVSRGTRSRPSGA